MTRARLAGLAVTVAGLLTDATAELLARALGGGPETPAPEGASRHAPPSPGPARHPVRAAPAPGPALTPQEAAILGALQHARHTRPGIARAAREVADGLRQRLPGTDDTTLGVIALEFHGYALAAAIGLPDQQAALCAITDVFGLAAEDLTRLARTEEAGDAV